MAKQAETSNSYVELPDDDRISNLPDSIRCHILSFLPTTDAVATTVLSTKWVNLWTTALNSIGFYDSCGPYDFHHDMTDEEREVLLFHTINFASFVNKVLLLHDVPVMKRFSLSCIQNYCVYDVYSWVSKAILKKVEELDLYMTGDLNEPIQLPISLFTCQTLEVLKLEGSIVVKMLTSCLLPRLKTLTLSSIRYENDESSRKLISSCPSLESLDIRRSRYDGVKNFTISSSTVKYLMINQAYRSEYDLTNHVINAPSLQHLWLDTGFVCGFVIENLSSLVKTDMIFLSVVDIGWYDSFSNLLQGICNSKIINIFAPDMFQVSFM